MTLPVCSLVLLCLCACCPVTDVTSRQVPLGHLRPALICLPVMMMLMWILMVLKMLMMMLFTDVDQCISFSEETKGEPDPVLLLRTISMRQEQKYRDRRDTWDRTGEVLIWAGLLTLPMPRFHCPKLGVVLCLRAGHTLGWSDLASSRVAWPMSLTLQLFMTWPVTSDQHSQYLQMFSLTLLPSSVKALCRQDQCKFAFGTFYNLNIAANFLPVLPTKFYVSFLCKYNWHV